MATYTLKLLGLTVATLTIEQDSQEDSKGDSTSYPVGFSHPSLYPLEEFTPNRRMEF